MDHSEIENDISDIIGQALTNKRAARSRLIKTASMIIGIVAGLLLAAYFDHQAIMAGII